MIKITNINIPFPQLSVAMLKQSHCNCNWFINFYSFLFLVIMRWDWFEQFKRALHASHLLLVSEKMIEKTNINIPSPAALCCNAKHFSKRIIKVHYLDPTRVVPAPAWSRFLLDSVGLSKGSACPPTLSNPCLNLPGEPLPEPAWTCLNLPEPLM